MKKQFDFKHGIETLRHWASFGTTRSAKTKTIKLQDWSAAKRMIEAVKPVMQENTKRLKELLELSRKKMQPLGEPLDLDLGVHRWLEEDREEAYSDWFAWVLKQLETPEMIFQVLGIPRTKETQFLKLNDVRREVLVPYGHNERSGRLDIVVDFETTVIAFEIKKGDADDSDTGKHTGYGRWLEEHRAKEKHGLFLVTSAEDLDYSGFNTRLWRDVCLELRRISLEMHKKKGLLTTAMILGFVAAVEQNLLKFNVSNTCDFHNNNISTNTDLISHLTTFIEEN